MTFLPRWSHGEPCDDELSQEGLAQSVNTHRDRDLLTPAGFPEQEPRSVGKGSRETHSPFYHGSLPLPMSPGAPDGKTQGLPSWGLDAGHGHPHPRPGPWPRQAWPPDPQSTACRRRPLSGWRPGCATCPGGLPRSAQEHSQCTEPHSAHQALWSLSSQERWGRCNPSALCSFLCFS